MLLKEDTRLTSRRLPKEGDLHHKLPLRVIALRNRRKDSDPEDAVVAEHLLQATGGGNFGDVRPRGFRIHGYLDGASRPFDGEEVIVH